MDYALFIEPFLPLVSYSVSVAGIIIIGLIVKEILGIKYSAQYEDAFSERIMAVSQTGLDDEMQKELILEIIKTSVVSEEKMV